MKFKNITDYILKRKNVLVLLISINIAASMIGFISYGYFYDVQLRKINPIFWLLVPDCPTFSLLYIFFLVSLLVDKENNTNGLMRILNAIVFVEIIRGAFISILYVIQTTGLYPEVVLAVHMGMILEGIAMIPYLKTSIDLKNVILEFSAVITFIAVNEFVDFFWKPPFLVMYIDIANYFDLYFIMVFILDVILLITFFVVSLRFRKHVLSQRSDLESGY
ncbi:MAG: DUF1405 domain-containing protein [Candidatus Hodarchaeales archaeon]